jgi:hypothetical protein
MNKKMKLYETKKQKKKITRCVSAAPSRVLAVPLNSKSACELQTAVIFLF